MHEAFRELAGEYRGTVYGRYAALALAMERFDSAFRVHNNKGGSQIWLPVADELEETIAVFGDPHPLRESGLLMLARAFGFALRLDDVKSQLKPFGVATLTASRLSKRTDYCMSWGACGSAPLTRAVYRIVPRALGRGGLVLWKTLQVPVSATASILAAIRTRHRRIRARSQTAALSAVAAAPC